MNRNDPKLNGSFDAELESLFASARINPPEPTPALLDRVLSDSLRLQPLPRRFDAGRSPNARRNGWRGLLDGLGGWPAVSGLATATVVGIWIGYNPPTTLAGLADGVLGTAFSGAGAELDQIDLLPSFDGYLAEG